MYTIEMIREWYSKYTRTIF